MVDFTLLGYSGLFIISFLAATILPFSSEIVLGALLIKGLNPYYLVAVATFGNVLGAFTNYLIGKYGGILLIKKILKIEEEKLSKVQGIFNRYGVYTLLFSWVPVIGDPLTVVSGLACTNIFVFSLFVFLGKFFRYAFLAGFINIF